MTSDIGPTGEPAKLTFSGDASRSLLVVDDDPPFRNRLARAMEKRGFDVVAVDSVAMGIEVAQESAPVFAVVDLRLGDGSGLDVVAALRDARPDSRIVVLTGYGNIATAVAAVKAGAVDYLPSRRTPTRSRRLCSPMAVHCRRRLKTPCRRIAYAGNIFSGYSSSATATYPRRRAA